MKNGYANFATGNIVRTERTTIFRPKFIKKNEERIRRAADFENHITYNYGRLMDECDFMPLSKYLERSMKVYKRLKRQFNTNYLNYAI